MIDIDMASVAHSITDAPVTPMGEPVEVTKNIRLHRFDEDRLHILVDGSGGYKAILHPHTPRESVLRTGNLAEFARRCSGSAEVEDREALVTLPGSPNDWTAWRISQNLTDRWGDLNDYEGDKKPLAPLENDGDLLERLRSQMWDEMTFIVRKDGQYGILFECEYNSRESESEVGMDPDPLLKLHGDVITLIDAAAVELERSFPGVEFAIPDEDEIANNRPALWAFVKDGLLDAEERERLGSIMLGI